jgi:hypothetical protein
VTLFIVLLGLLVVWSGVVLYRCRRIQDDKARAEQEEKAAVFLEGERQRLKANTARVLKEVADSMKVRHPDSTRHSRRAVASRYRSAVNSA